MTSIELRNIPYQRLPSLKRRPRPGKSGAIQDIIQHGGPLLLATALGSTGKGNGGWLRYFANANPPWAGSAVNSAVNMARYRSYTRTTTRKRRRFFRKRGNRSRRFVTSRRNKCRYKIVTRVLQQYDGSANKPTTGIIITLSPKGGIHKFVFPTSLLQDIKKQIGAEYTHYKVIKYKIRMIPEAHSHPTLEDVAKNDQRSAPTCFKSYHIGLTAPASLQKLLNSQGVKPFDPTHQQNWSIKPKFLYKLTGAQELAQKPKNYWIPMDTEATNLNGPIIGWSTYKIPGDTSALPQSYRYKVIISATVAFAKFTTYVTDKVAFHNPIAIHSIGGVLSAYPG
ncbi:capsid protein [Red mite associated cyclovirus 1]|nr:capsid protein [Red mite associated cyclovirus 1]